MSGTEIIKQTKDKTLKSKSFIIDINLIEAPLFQFKTSATTMTAEALEKSDDISNEVKYIIGTMPQESKKSQVEFLRWTDSRGLDREILAASIFKLPNAFAMDVFYGLLGLYIKKNTPIAYVENDNVFNMPENKIEFRIKELCEFMKISTGGKMYQRIKDAVRELSAVKYYSLGNGTLYNKKKERYEVSKEKSISLIADYEFIQRKASKSEDMCEVIFGNLIMENIKYNYIKFLNTNIFFSLKSGLTRRLYAYLDGNRYNKTYIKRDFSTLRYKIPISFKYVSELKKRIKKPLESLIEADIIKDYFYGDEIFINGNKDESIYFIFKGTKEEVINSLTVKKIEVPKQEIVEKKEELTFPENIRQEILNFGVSEKKVEEVMVSFSKYQLAEYILWLKDGIKKGKVKDKAAMFVFAIDTGAVKVEISNPEIHEFVLNYKKEVEGKINVSEQIIKDAYDEYIKKELELFETEEEFMFSAMRDTLIGDLSSQVDKNVKTFKSLMNVSTSESEKQASLKLITKWEAFARQKEESELFREQFIKNVSLYKGLKDYSQFKNEFISENQ